MIETVSTSSVQGVALRSLPQASASAHVSQSAPASNESFVSSRIRMDNFLNMAILEFRNGESGAVIQQYPTESQIRAFQRASELEPKEVAAPVQADNFTFAEVSTAPTSSPSPSPAVSSEPSPAPSPAPSVASTEGGSAVHSVLV